MPRKALLLPGGHAALPQQTGACLVQKGKHSGGNAAFHRANGEMNGLHGQQKRTKGQRRNAGGQRFYGYRERPQLQRKDAADQRCGDNFRMVQPLAGKGAPDQPAHKTTVERHIPDVGPQRHQAAVGKQKALDEQHADHPMGPTMAASSMPPHK